jgi:hypothetical protein
VGARWWHAACAEEFYADRPEPPRRASTRTKCRNGHLRTDVTTYVRADGSRECLVCRIRSQRDYWLRKGEPWAPGEVTLRRLRTIADEGHDVADLFPEEPG